MFYTFCYFANKSFAPFVCLSGNTSRAQLLSLFKYCTEQRTNEQTINSKDIINSINSKVVLVLQLLLCGTRAHLAFVTLPLPIPSVTFLKLTASSRLTAPPSGSPMCLRFNLWLKLCTLNIDLLTYLLTTYSLFVLCHVRCAVFEHRYRFDRNAKNFAYDAFCYSRYLVVLQGKDFWLRYLLTYRSFSSHHGFIGRTAPTLPQFSELVDWIFIQLHEIFVDGIYQFMCHCIILVE